jgi:cytochrome c oxidase assembly factor CtaG
MSARKPSEKISMPRKKRLPALKANEPSSDQIHRIVPLGLTIQEAKAWYRYDVLMPWLYRGLLAVVVASALIVSTLTPLDEYLESSLSFHMVVQHFLFIAAGFLFAYGMDSLILAASPLSRMLSQTYTLLLRASLLVNRRGIVGFVTAAMLTAYWHLPASFSTAVLSESVHVEMHATFLIVGSLVFVGSKLLTKKVRHIAPIIVGKAMGLFGAFLLFTPSYVYPVYPVREQSEAGLVMVVMMLVMDLTIAPYWLYNYFEKGLQTSLPP